MTCLFEDYLTVSKGLVIVNLSLSIVHTNIERQDLVARTSPYRSTMQANLEICLLLAARI